MNTEGLKHLKEACRTKALSMFSGDKEKVVTYLKAHRELVDLAYADEICRKSFTFNQPWDMEKCSETVSFSDEIDWCYCHNNDREWMWMLNRHHFWLPVLAAYLVTGEKKYLGCVLEQWEHWLDTQTGPEGKNLTSWRTIDAGIRLANWVKALPFIMEEEELTEDLLQKLLRSVKVHIEYLFDRYHREYSLTNWRVLEFHGVFLASVYFDELKEAEKWRERALEILEECICLQVTGDGFHWEQSYMYHVEMLLCMSEVLLIGARNGLEISEVMKEVTKKMADAMVHMITPEGKQICHGDSDVEDLRGLLSGLAFLFQEETYWYFAPKEPDLATVMSYGSPLIEMWGQARKRPPEALDYAHEDVGNYFSRTGWGDKDSFLFFKNGFLGSGHGHCDLLHFEIISKGVPVLVDSGRFTYRDDTPKRQQLKGPKAHNTILVDGKEFTVQKGSWDNKKVATAIKRPCVLLPEITYFQGAHLGYFDRGVFLNRKLIYIKPGIWFLIDECLSGENHKYQQYFHFAKKQVRLEGRKAVYEDRGQAVSMEFLGKGALTGITLEPAFISPGYNKSYEACMIQASYAGTGMTALPVVFAACEAQGETGKEALRAIVEEASVTDMYGHIVPEAYARAFHITRGEEHYLLYTNHQEEPEGRKQYLIDGNVVYGRTGVISFQSGKAKQTVLEY